MDIDGFWDVIDAARARTVTGTPFHEVLASRGEPEILDFQELFEEMRRGIFRWDVWAVSFAVSRQFGGESRHVRQTSLVQMAFPSASS